METQLIAVTGGGASAATFGLPLPVLWRDPHSVPREALEQYIEHLEKLCGEQPQSPDLWTCLGLAYAMDYRVYSSMRALETARDVAPGHFWAQFKFAELHYRLRALPLAEQEMLKAVNLASTPAEYSVSRRHLQEIRGLMRVGTKRPALVKPMTFPFLLLAGLVVVLLMSGAFWQ